MTMGIISGDSHIDLPWLPPELFVENAVARVKDRMPHVLDGPSGQYWTIAGGWQGVGMPLTQQQHFMLVNGIGIFGVKYRPGHSHRTDRISSEGVFADGQKGIRRITDPDMRAKDQDRDGVRGEVIFGLTGIERFYADNEAVAEIYRIYNEWLSDFCRRHPNRHIGLACVLLSDVEAAVRQVKEAARMGLKGILVYPHPNPTGGAGRLPLWHEALEPIWAAAADGNLHIHIHSTGPDLQLPPREASVLNHNRARGVFASSFQLSSAAQLPAMIFSGVFERYPNLKLVLGEFGAGWIPYMVDMMDKVSSNRNLGRDCGLKKAPSEYYREHVMAVIIDEPLVGSLLTSLGEDNLMFGTDFPHIDGTWPDSHAEFEKHYGTLKQDVKEKLAWRNAARVYGLN